MCILLKLSSIKWEKYTTHRVHLLWISRKLSVHIANIKSTECVLQFLFFFFKYVFENDDSHKSNLSHKYTPATVWVDVFNKYWHKCCNVYCAQMSAFLHCNTIQCKTLNDWFDLTSIEMIVTATTVKTCGSLQLFTSSVLKMIICTQIFNFILMTMNRDGHTNGNLKSGNNMNTQCQNFWQWKRWLILMS